MRDVGGSVKTLMGIAPVVKTADATINGPGIDRRGYEGAVFCLEVGAKGDQTGHTVDCKIQESDDNSSWSDVSGATFTQITTENTHGELNLNLQGRKRYVRMVVTITITGGSSPSIAVGGTVVLGNPKQLPA